MTPHALMALYREACREPDGHPSLLVQTLVGTGLDADRAEALRAELAWDAVPLVAYDDAVDGLRALSDAGLRVGVLANQPASARDDLERAGLLDLCDGVWLSEPEGLAKPDPRFFRLALDAYGLRPGAVAYVGDRPDNDVAPANAMGLASVRLRRGPHAEQAARGASERAWLDAGDLAEVCARLVSGQVS